MAKKKKEEIKADVPHETSFVFKPKPKYGNSFSEALRKRADERKESLKRFIDGKA